MSLEGSTAAAATSENSPFLRALFFGMLAREEQERRITHAIAVFNPTSGSLSIIHGPTSLDALFQAKPGTFPATKDSIAALTWRRTEEEDVGGGKDCAICLEEFEIGVEVSEMPCKHWFHRGCVERWLRINGSCPVCRYAMPVEEHGVGEKRGEEDTERRGETPVTIMFTLVIDGSNRWGFDAESSRGVAPGAEFADGAGESEGPAGDVAS